MKTRFRSWHIRSSWILSMCPIQKITGSKPQNDKQLSLFITLLGVFPLWNDLHRWSRLIICQSVVFPLYRKNIFTPDFLLRPDKYTRPLGRDRQWKHSVNTEDAVSPSADWGPGERSLANFQFSVQQIRKFTHRFHSMENTSSLKKHYSAPWLITSWENTQHHPLILNAFVWKE